MSITGAHAIIFSRQAEKLRDFFREVIGFSHVDAGHGWLIFALPPAELAIHPTQERGSHELFLMCDDVKATVAELREKGAKFKRPIKDAGWGRLATMRLPGGATMGIYEPRHASPLAVKKAKKAPRSRRKTSS
jgi:predicted enzyme related to lactoylglutathione lyase